MRRCDTQGGFTLLETLIAMTLFAIGVLALAQVQLAASRSNMSARRNSTAALLAQDRIEQCVHAAQFDDITPANFVNENYGSVEHADPRYKNFKRTVDIVDTQDITGRATLKTVTVRVRWKTLQGDRELHLASSVARF